MPRLKHTHRWTWNKAGVGTCLCYARAVRMTGLAPLLVERGSAIELVEALLRRDARRRDGVTVCPSCGLDGVGRGPDPCFRRDFPQFDGLIPGVSHACCGHDEPILAYAIVGGEPRQGISTHDRWIDLRGLDALAFFTLARRAINADPEESLAARQRRSLQPLTLVIT